MAHLVHLIVSRANEKELLLHDTNKWTSTHPVQQSEPRIETVSTNEISPHGRSCEHVTFKFSFSSPFTAKAKTHQEFLSSKIQEYSEFFQMDKPDETGMDRLKKCLSNIVNHSSEGKLVQQTFLCSSMFGFVVGTLVRQKDRVQAFQKKFNHLQFEGQYQASRKLADVVLLSTLKYASSLAIKFSFIPTFTMAAICCSMAYRNYINPLDFALITGTAGALYKINLGVRAMGSAGIVGSGLGLIAGSIVWSVFKLSGTTVPEWRYWTNESYKRQQEYMSNKSWEKWAEKMQELKSLHAHDKLHEISVGQRQILQDLDNIPDFANKPTKSTDNSLVSQEKK